MAQAVALARAFASLTNTSPRGAAIGQPGGNSKSDGALMQRDDQRCSPLWTAAGSTQEQLSTAASNATTTRAITATSMRLLSPGSTSIGEVLEQNEKIWLAKLALKSEWTSQ